MRLSNPPGTRKMSKNSIGFTLSAKVVKKMTREELGYELSWNAFELLNQKAKKYLVKGFEVEEVNNWVMRVLNRFKENMTVRRCDIEAVIEQEEVAGLFKTNKILDNHIVSDDRIISGFDAVIDIKEIDIIQLPSIGQVGLVKELEEEIERLKKIIQIILNKQAELV